MHRQTPLVAKALRTRGRPRVCDGGIGLFPLGAQTLVQGWGVGPSPGVVGAVSSPGCLPCASCILPPPQTPNPPLRPHFSNTPSTLPLSPSVPPMPLSSPQPADCRASLRPPTGPDSPCLPLSPFLTLLNVGRRCASARPCIILRCSLDSEGGNAMAHLAREAQLGRGIRCHEGYILARLHGCSRPLPPPAPIKTFAAPHA